MQSARAQHHRPRRGARKAIISKVARHGCNHHAHLPVTYVSEQGLSVPNRMQPTAALE